MISKMKRTLKRHIMELKYEIAFQLFKTNFTQIIKFLYTEMFKFKITYKCKTNQCVMRLNTTHNAYHFESIPNLK